MLWRQLTEFVLDALEICGLAAVIWLMHDRSLR